METGWTERGWARWSAVAVLVVGLVLAGVGVWGLVAAAGSDDDADRDDARTAEIRDQIAALDAERVQAEADARSASDLADELAIASGRVQMAADELAVLYNDATDASNAMVDCDGQATEAAFVSCVGDALGTFQDKLGELRDGTDSLRRAMADLQEGLQ
jgi:hypothetical protein